MRTQRSPRMEEFSMPLAALPADGNSAPRRRHPGLDILELSRDTAGEQPIAGLRDQHLVLDPHAETALREVDAGLYSKDSPDGQGQVIPACVVHVEADEVAETVDERLQVARSLERNLRAIRSRL